MTKMKRITVSFPDEVDSAVIALRKRDEYARCTYSEIIRRLVIIGLEFNRDSKQAGKS